MFNPYLNNGGRLAPRDEPTTREIPRDGDEELIRGVHGGNEPKVPHRGHRVVRPPRREDEIPAEEREAKSKARLGRRTVYSNRIGEVWQSVLACARAMSDERARSGVRVCYRNKRILAAIESGEEIEGRRLSFTPFGQQREVA